MKLFQLCNGSTLKSSESEIGLGIHAGMPDGDYLMAAPRANFPWGTVR